MKFISRFTGPVGLVISFSLLVSCGPQPKEQAESTEESVEEEVVEVASGEAAPEAILVIMHEVEDFSSWKTAFDDHKSMREESGLTDFDVFQKDGNPNTVAIGFGCSDLAKAKDFMASEDLKSAMQNAGVIGEPQMSFIKSDVEIEGESPSTEYLSVVHEVSDYTTWRKAFDADETNRQEAGLVLRDLSRNLDNPNEIWILFAVTDRTKADAFLNSEKLAQVMEEAGVVGELQMGFWSVASNQPM